MRGKRISQILWRKSVTIKTKLVPFVWRPSEQNWNHRCVHQQKNKCSSLLKLTISVQLAFLLLADVTFWPADMATTEEWFCSGAFRMIWLCGKYKANGTPGEHQWYKAAYLNSLNCFWLLANCTGQSLIVSAFDFPHFMSLTDSCQRSVSLLNYRFIFCVDVLSGKKKTCFV